MRETGSYDTKAQPKPRLDARDCDQLTIHPLALKSAAPFDLSKGILPLNISKHEQRTLHVLARGGAILVEKDERNKIAKVNCISPEGWTLSDCTLSVFKKLKKRRLIASRGGGPYRITYHGRVSVRPQLDNRA